LRYEYAKPANTAMLMSLARHLNGKFPGTKWTVLSRDAIQRLYGAKFAEAKGFFKSNGEIIINSDLATMETPFHEYGHVYLQYLKAENLAEYESLMKMAEEHPLYGTMVKTYSQEDAPEEVFVELLSLSATNQLLTSDNPATGDILGTMADTTGIFGKFLGKMKQFVNWLFNINENIELGMNDSLASVINKLATDMLFKEGSILGEFSEEAQAAVQYIRFSPTITVQEGRDILIKRGYIEWLCS